MEKLDDLLATVDAPKKTHEHSRDDMMMKCKLWVSSGVLVLWDMRWES